MKGDEQAELGEVYHATRDETGDATSKSTFDGPRGKYGGLAGPLFPSCSVALMPEKSRYMAQAPFLLHLPAVMVHNLSPHQPRGASEIGALLGGFELNSMCTVRSEATIPPKMPVEKAMEFLKLICFTAYNYCETGTYLVLCMYGVQYTWSRNQC